MAAIYGNVRLSTFSESFGQFCSKSDVPYKLSVRKELKGAALTLTSADSSVLNVSINNNSQICPIGQERVVVSKDTESMMLQFATDREAKAFLQKIKELTNSKRQTLFDQRTDDSSAAQYFQFYGYLSQQQNMMQDYIRTSTYQRAMLSNPMDFTDKVVLDVGAGSGILSFFAVQAGARRVYAIEASSMAEQCQQLVNSNKLNGRIVVISGKVEEVDLPENVDIIISEPMGYMLYNERMLETYLHGKKWLKPGGKMFPTIGDLHIAPFTDESLYMEQYTKANFWYQNSFHGVDLTCLRENAVNEYFKQPIVDTFDVRICLARSQKYTVNFQEAEERDLHIMEIPVTFSMLQSGTVHGLAFWFDVAFIGSHQTIWLSTAPTEPLTHWYQVRCMLPSPVFVKQGQTLNGKVTLKANERQSYDVEITLTYPGTNNVSTNTLDLKNPYFRYTGQAPQPPPGTNTESPTDAYWNNMMTGQQMQHYAANGLVNGSSLVQQQQMQQQAPINPGSIPSVGSVCASNATRTSVGGGISPAVFAASPGPGQSPGVFSISNQYMIGDYMMPGNIVMPEQGPSYMKTDR